MSPIDGPWEHVDVAANGARFHLAVGRRFATSRRLVVLLHGFAEFWWAWRHQLEPLDAAGYAVAAMDLRGYGDSDKTPRGYDTRTTASDVAGVIRGLGHRRAVLVGHDWGGTAAWATAAYVPEQVRALAMVAAPFPLGRHRPPALPFAVPGLAERRLTADDGAYVEQLLRERAAPGRDWLSADDARRYREALLTWPSARCACEYERNFLRDRFRAAGRDFRRTLRELEPVSLLSIHGDLDPILSLAEMSLAGRYVGGGRHELISLPDVGHLPHEEDPAACTAALLRWLDDLD